MIGATSSLTVLASTVRIYARMAVLAGLRRPYKLTFLVSGGCNLRCQVCSIWREKNTTVTLAEASAIWHALSPKPCWINISGGEPTLNRELEGILSFFVRGEKPLLVTLTTNGYADCSELVARVLEQNRRSLLYVSVSLDGEEADHDAARGRPRSFARALTTYRRLRALRARFPRLGVGVSTTVSRVNRDRILPFITRLLAEETPVSVNIAQASPYYANEASDSFRALPPGELVALLRTIQRRLPKLRLDSLPKISFLDGVIAHIEGRYTPVPCSSHVSNVLVTSELDLMDCTVLFQPWGPKDAPRDAKLAHLLAAIRNPSSRQRALAERIRRSGCEQRCHTPCESYVHTISALLDPRWAPRLLGGYLRVCAEAALDRRVLQKQAAA